MKKSTIIRFIALLGVIILLLFNSAELKAQTDILDLCPPDQDQFNCETTPDIVIPVNLDGLGLDTMVIIRNISGFRLFHSSSSITDKKYKFFAPNNPFCGTGTVQAGGEFRILFMQNSVYIGVKKLSFILLDNSGTNYGAKAYNGITECTMSSNSVTGGKQFTYDNVSIPIDKVVVTCDWTNSITDTTQCFVMDKLFMPSPFPAPAGVISGPSSVCQGQNGVSYSVAAIANATSYSWSYSGTGATISGNTNPVTIDFATNATSGNLTVYGVNAYGNGTASTYSIAVNPSLPVSVTVAPSANPVCAGTSVTFTATPTNGGTTPAYQWQVNGTNVGTNSTIYTYTPGNGDIVKVILTSNAACPTGNPATSAPVTMTVNPSLPVSVTVAPSANPVCAGTSVIFTATPTNGGTTPAYQWQVNGTNVGTNSTIYTYTPGNGDIVKVILTSNAACPTGNPATSAPVTMTVNPSLPVSVTVAPSANPVCAGTSVTFTATPTNGGTTPAYQWQVNGTNVGTNSTIYTYTPGNGDIVKVILTSNAACPTGNPATSAPVTMTVNPSLPVSVTVAPSANPVCAGTSVIFTATPTNGGTTPAYQWQVNGTNVGTNSTIYTYTPGNGDIVKVILTSNAACPTGNPATSAPVTMTVNPLAAAAGTITGTAKVCQGQASVTYTVPEITNATGYVWSLPTGATITAGTNTNSITVSFSTSATSGIITVYGTNACGNGTVSANYPVTVNSVDPAGLPEVVCLFDLSWSMNRDFYDNPTSDPHAVKLFHTKNALTAFVDLLCTNNPDLSSLGLARFPNSPQVGCDAGIIEILQTLTSAYNSNLSVNIIPYLIADGNSTPLLAGIDSAIKMFNCVNNKIIVLLSDGRQNCPTSNITASMIDATKNTLNGAGITLYTIGFGDNLIVPNDMLNAMATGTGGVHYNITALTGKSPDMYDPSHPDVWNAGTALQAAFANIIKVGLDLGAPDDPLDIINRGAVKQFDIPITIFDNKVCFFVSWITPQENYLGVKLYTPSGIELSLGQAGISTINRKNHTIITLSGAILNQPGMTGTWHLKIDGSGLNSASEYYQHTVLSSSKKLDMKTWFEKGRLFAGDKIKIYLEVLLDGKPLTGLDKISLMGTRPAMSPGNWLVSKKIDTTMLERARQKQLAEYLKWLTAQSQFEKMNKEAKEKYLNSQKQIFLNNIDPIELRVHALVDEYKLPLPGRVAIKGLNFTDEGKNGDQTAGDGIFTAVYVPQMEGSYSFNISCTSTLKGEKILRESHLQTYVGTKIRIKPVFKNIRLIEKALKGENVFDVTFSLNDSYGNTPLSSALNEVKLSIDRGQLIDGIVDNMDGTFTQRISLPGNIKPKNVTMTLSYDNMSGSRKIAVYKLILDTVLVSILVIVTAAIFMRKKKKTSP